MFVVGIFSGADKLGEGFGSSLRMAEYRAAEDSLHRLYLTRHPLTSSEYPSSTFDGAENNIYQPLDMDNTYNPAPIGYPEVLLGSAGRTGSTVEASSYEREAI
jgi:large subunit ribosomal protein L44